MKSSMSIDVDFLAGTDIKDAITEAKEKAILFNVAYVCFSFNKKRFSITRNCDIYEAVEQYKSDIDSIIE